MYCTGFGSLWAEHSSGDGLRFFFLRGSRRRLPPFLPYTWRLLGLAAIGLLYWVDMAVNLLLLLRADMALMAGLPSDAAAQLSRVGARHK